MSALEDPVERIAKRVALLDVPIGAFVPNDLLGRRGV